MSLLNTDQKREKEHLAQMLTIARDYARSKGFTGTFLIEPKPMEPTKHQYDVDTETVVGFLKTHGLDKDFKVNIEVNHATLAGHTFEHELAVAVDNGMLGSIDANRGDYQNGWDTDQFPIDNYELTQAMMQIIRNGGLGNGGTNFDAKTRRNSTDLDDIFLAHISGMDSFARALMLLPISWNILITRKCVPNVTLVSTRVTVRSSKKVNFSSKTCVQSLLPLANRSKSAGSRNCMR